MASNYKPERKVVGAAVATLAVWGLQVAFNVEVPIGVEGAIAVVVGYLVPSKTA